MDANNEIVKLTDISKFFPGIKALSNVSLSIEKGRVHALIGENGAGKSTLVKILTGIYRPDAGELFVRGQQRHFKSPLDSQKAGITAIHQETTMFPNLSVLENIFMGHHLKKKRTGLVDWKQMTQKTLALMEELEISIHPNTLVSHLTVGERHLIEIVKALSFQAEVVIMDEPTSALSLKEVADLYRIIQHLKDEGKAIVFISHKFDEIFEIADFYSVLRDGKLVGEGAIDAATVDTLVKLMVGRDMQNMFPKKDVLPGEAVLSVNHYTRAGAFQDITFQLHAGEILGFFGLVGAGRTEVMQSIFGLAPPSQGEILVNGEKTRIHSPKDALRKGIAYVPEDRQLQGVILDMNIQNNITLPIIEKLSKGLFLVNTHEKQVADKYGKLLEIKAATWTQQADELSGGNQQKVVLAKWLATEPAILILDEPTKGIDVATKTAVHGFMSDLAEKGIAIILVSSELPEILGMSDHILVMYHGAITARFAKDEADSESIILAATGHHKQTLEGRTDATTAS